MTTFLLPARRLLAGVLLVCATAQAQIAINLTPTTQTIQVGQTALLDLTISGLGDGVSPSLGSWIAELSFNNSIVTISDTDVTFGTGLDLGIFGSLNFVSSSSGLVEAGDVSFEDPAALVTSQAPSFTLATFAFTGAGPGTTSVVFSRLELSDETGLIRLDESNGFVANTARITVIDPNRVPDEATALPLLAGALALLFVASRRRAAIAR